MPVKAGIDPLGRLIAGTYTRAICLEDILNSGQEQLENILASRKEQMENNLASRQGQLENTWLPGKNNRIGDRL